MTSQATRPVDPDGELFGLHLPDTFPDSFVLEVEQAAHVDERSGLVNVGFNPDPGVSHLGFGRAGETMKIKDGLRQDCKVEAALVVAHWARLYQTKGR